MSGPGKVELPLSHLSRSTTQHVEPAEPTLASSLDNDQPDSRRRLLQFQVRQRPALRDLWHAFETRISTRVEKPRVPDLESNVLPPRESLDYRPAGRPSAASAAVPFDVDHDQLAALPDDHPVDIVVVDRDWTDSVRYSTDNDIEKPFVPSPSVSGQLASTGKAASVSSRSIGNRDSQSPWYRLWSSFWHFFVFVDDDFDEEMEAKYSQESWNRNKVRLPTALVQTNSQPNSSSLLLAACSSLSTGLLGVRC